MRIFDVTINKDYEEIKRFRREALADRENIEFLVEHGATGMLKKRYVYRVSGGNRVFPVYTLSFKTAASEVFKALIGGVIWNSRQLKNKLFPPKSSVCYEHSHHNAGNAR